jgi:hypothetical protein
VRPDHLFLGTHQDNVDDMFSKERANKAYGEQHGRAKLTEKSVLKLFKMSQSGKYTQRELASRFGLHPVYLNKLLRGHKWKHLHQG